MANEERDNREIGSAEKQLPYLDPHTSYVIIVDSYNTKVDICAVNILSLLK